MDVHNAPLAAFSTTHRNPSGQGNGHVCILLDLSAYWQISRGCTVHNKNKPFNILDYLQLFNLQVNTCMKYIKWHKIYCESKLIRYSINYTGSSGATDKSFEVY